MLFRSRISRQRSTSRKEDLEVDDAVEVEDVEDDVASREGRQEFGQRRSSRPDRRQSFSSRKVRYSPRPYVNNSTFQPIDIYLQM